MYGFYNGMFLLVIITFTGPKYSFRDVVKFRFEWKW